MNKRKKDAVIAIPLIAVSAILIITILIPLITSPGDIYIQPTETLCQEGWFKYELKSGTLCSKTELTESQLEEYE